MILDVENLVWSFRKTVVLPTPGEPYGGWEGPMIELRGHFVEHYMSGTALMWASTHHKALFDKMTSLVSALAACQNVIGTAYLSSFPSDFFDCFEAVQYVWVSYYSIHKICDLPFAFFSDPQLTPVLVGTLLAVCYGCEQNRDVVQQELSMDMLLVLLKSSKQDLQASPDSKQMIVPRVLDVQSNSVSYQSGTMDVIMEESEEEMQNIQVKGTPLTFQEMSRKLPVASPVDDIPTLSHQQPSARPCKISLISDHANSTKRLNRNVSKSASQGDSASKESSTRINALGKAAKGKPVSFNKEFSANQGKCLRVPNPESVQRAPPISSKRSGSAIFPELKTSSSIGSHSHGLKVAKEDQENPLLSPAFKLSNRFPVNLIDRAQEFFAAGLD